MCLKFSKYKQSIHSMSYFILILQIKMCLIVKILEVIWVKEFMVSKFTLKTLKR